MNISYNLTIKTSPIFLVGFAAVSTVIIGLPGINAMHSSKRNIYS